MDEANDNSILPINYLKIFFRRKELLLIPAFLGLVLGICTGITLPKQYKSSTILLVEEGKTDNPLFEQLAVSTTVSQRMSSIRESMLGWYSLVILVERLNLAENIKTRQEFEKLLLGIRSHIDIKLRAHNIIDLSYTGKNPEQTRDVVKNITEIFIEKNVNAQNQETSDAIVFIEEQLKLYRSKIKSSEIAGIKENLKILLLDSTENHPTVKELRKQLQSKEDELKKENLEYIEDAQLDAKSVNPLVDQIRSALDNVDRGGSIKVASGNLSSDYFKLLLVDKLDEVMARDAGVNNEIYLTLLSRLETAKITQRLQTSKEGTRYTVLDPPRVPLKPSKPNKLLVALIGFFAGGLFGMGLIFSIEFLDQSFIDVEDANKFFNTPLLGAISKIQTEFNIRKEREKRAWVYSFTALTGVVLIVLTTAIMNYIG